ncbi:unnamed protein product [Amoebophrya sp. A120]|nr:unnamed protein product [Amoebophrya sp. A120]|eukprot:GSA120T00006224001.1
MAPEISAKEALFPVDGPGMALRQDGMSLDTVDGPGRSKPYYATRNLLTLTSVHEPKKPLFAPLKEPISYQKTYYPNPVRRPRDLSLCVADIAYAQPALVETSGRHTNPLQPQYQFLGATQVKPVEPYVARFGGNFILETRDIEGAAPKRMIPDRNYVRHNTDCSDIAYATPNYFGRHVKPSTFIGHRKYPYEEPPVRPRDFRETNPLDPEYRMSQQPPQVRSQVTDANPGAGVPNLPSPVNLGKYIPGSKPRKLQWSNSEPQFSLLSQDIAGAAPQRYVGELPFNLYEARTMRSKPVLNTVSHDIPGAQVGTLKTGVVSTRNTNPLIPSYVFLDGKLSPWDAQKSPASIGGHVSAHVPELHVRPNAAPGTM